MSAGWKPLADVQMKSASAHASGVPWVKRRAMIDSGAFMSIVDHKTGKQMGFTAHPNDTKHKFHTDTGSGGYLKRDMLIRVGKHREAKVPVAWAPKSEKAGLEILIGRRGLFKNFDITFSGSDRKVTFQRSAASAALEAAAADTHSKRINGT
eukprot:TRINITY_DN2315_c0_g2_i1.p1 TRINITY_DN2315_c0_g2~~TRINITY_DN2315_c0_g2_i1.p1  ORF type:complete len:152 (+),score=26.17 TRINITY_DN2315_c0_g2_i1:346-801(+)